MRQGLLLSFVLGVWLTATLGATPVRTAGESTTFAIISHAIQPLYDSSSAGKAASVHSAFLLPARGEPSRPETSVPEPETFALIGFGLLFIGMVGARRYRH